MIRAVAAEGCDAIVILCTNMDGAAHYCGPGT